MEDPTFEQFRGKVFYAMIKRPETDVLFRRRLFDALVENGPTVGAGNEPAPSSGI